MLLEIKKMKQKSIYNLLKTMSNRMTVVIGLVLFFHTYHGFGQVTTAIDSTSIQIGSEIRYQVQVALEGDEVIVFPEGQTFTPLEVIESYQVDTLKHADKIHITKEYALTQFDSGHYTIPRQKIQIGERIVFTDSLQVAVRDVVVDTTKQKMYPIKPMVAVEYTAPIDWKKYAFWTLGILVLIGGTLLVVRMLLKKKALKEEELPAYERALLALQQIDQSDLLEKESHKEYYSRLSDTARKYINEEVYDHAMESTTDELIAKLDEEIKTGSLALDRATVEELKSVLKTADMAKFAKSKPDKGVAKADRNVIEKVITETKAAIPEPTEEELWEDEAYRQELAARKKRQAFIIGGVSVIGVLMISLLIFVMMKGAVEAKDILFGHPTKELAEGEWISSTYGTPGISITTPKVLIRNNFQLTEEQRQILKGNETFIYGSGLLGDFYVAVTTVQFQQQMNVDLEKAVEGAIKGMEAQGGKNITFKTDEYETLGGVKGLKVYGELEGTHPLTKQEQKAEYSMLYFAEQGGYQQIVVVYTKDDRYAKDITERVINSVEIKNAD